MLGGFHGLPGGRFGVARRLRGLGVGGFLVLFLLAGCDRAEFGEQRGRVGESGGLHLVAASARCLLDGVVQGAVFAHERSHLFEDLPHAAGVRVVFLLTVAQLSHAFLVGALLLFDERLEIEIVHDRPFLAFELPCRRVHARAVGRGGGERPFTAFGVRRMGVHPCFGVLPSTRALSLAYSAMRSSGQNPCSIRKLSA